MFWVVDGEQASFEQTFGACGAWQALLACSEGYLGTEARCESQVERRYRVLDFWTSHAAFETFRGRFAGRYEKFNRLVSDEGLIERQWLVGTYYIADPNDTEGDDFVLA